MRVVGDLVEQIGIAMFIGGYALWGMTLMFRIGAALVWRRAVVGRSSFAQSLLIGFYARAIGTVGMMAWLTGAILGGAMPWPWLIAVFVIGAPSLALLLVRPVHRDAPPLGINWSKKR